MDKTVTYTNHLGESVELGPGSHAHITDTELHSRSWEWDERNGELVGVRRPAREVTLEFGLAGGGLAERDRIADVMEADTVAGVDGSLQVNGWSLACRAMASEKDAWWFDDDLMHDSVTLVSADPVWIRDVEHHFSTLAEDEGGEADLGDIYPRPYPHGYWSPASRDGAVENGSVAASGFLWRVFGPCTSPTALIGGTQRSCSVVLASGDRLEVDTRAKTAVTVSSSGIVTNVFDRLSNGVRGSGSYAFEPLPPGRSEVSWSGGFSFDVVVHEERGEPSWS